MKLIIFYAVFQFIYVMLVTWKAIVTVKGGRWLAGIANAITFAFYTYVIVNTANGNLPVWQMAVITGLCNLIGVFIVKTKMDAKKKYELWKVELAIPSNNADAVKTLITASNISYNMNICERYALFNCYCEKPTEVRTLKNLCQTYNGKISAYENKLI